MKVLFVGGGRRVSLANRFIAGGFDVLAYETDVRCPVASIGEVIQGKKWNEAGIEEDLLNVFSERKIDIAIPLQDAATTILSRISNKTFTKIPTASEETNSLCLNKTLFEKKLCNEDIYPSVEKNCDVMIKPVFGFNSKGIKRISYYDYSRGEYDEEVVAQKFIDGKREVSVDAYFNRDAKMVDAVPRWRVEVQGGEVSKSTTMRRDEFGLIEITRKIGEQFGLIGPTCCQYIIDNNDKPFIMEINARFGGGVILSLEAGLDMVSIIKNEYIEGITYPPRNHNWKESFSMVRYFQEYFYE
jgi:carbamoyl-phosphate synthase large subunit